jgi:ABC-type amino acid transport system permease subunit
MGHTAGGLLLLAAAFMVLVAGPLPVHASGTLDQQQSNETAIINGLDSGQSLAQTFTAGLTGTLTEVDLALACFTDSPPICTGRTVTVQIFSGTPPGTGPLGSQTLLASTIPLDSGASTPFTAITFTVPIVAGNVYSIILTSSAASGSLAFDMRGIKSNVYAGGNSYHNTGGGWVLDGGGQDWAFKTFVTTTSPPIPEYPFGLPLLAILTLIAYGVIRRRTRY